LTESDRDRASKDRFARNEAIFREVNERVYDVKDSETRMTNFLCECGNIDCVEEVSLEDVETVIEETDRFNVVEKHPREARIAEATDPNG
jgi:ADP-dependent phosphofructokinase/glucokinase